MRKLKFKCTLETDVVLNVKSSSEGANSTLDFIPGSCFLGVVASQLYDEVSKEEAMALFHSSRVRFGDAHPSVDSKRALRVPASFFYAKGDTVQDACYIHHFIEKFENIKAKNGEKAQVKQCRNGFYLMSETECRELKTNKSFAIKSAYDRDERRSKDASMYGYESLSKGISMLFSVEIDDDVFAGKIKDALVGEKRIGRSRTAQYGLVKIEECDYDDEETYSSDNQIAIYADSRLIFLDDNGLPTCRPSVQQLLGDNSEGEIIWDKSQIRTFQYAPWNYKRQCYDTDRFGIEKGSVIIVENCKNANISSGYIGSYNNEGFGKIICNPIFLQAQPGKNGLSKCVFKGQEDDDKNPETSEYSFDSLLIRYLQDKKQENERIQSVYDNVEKFDESHLFIGKEQFASQWGAIRSIALRCKDADTLRSEIEDYISRGVKKEDWNGKRAEELIEFMNNNHETLWESIINLASEMAKKCKK